MALKSSVGFSRITNYISLISALLLVTQFPFYFGKIQRLVYAIFFFAYILDVIADQRWRQFSWKGTKNQWFFISLLAFFSLQFFYYPFEQNTLHFPQIIEHRLPFLAIGIIGLIGFNKKYKLKYFAWTFIVTSVVLCVFLLSMIDKEMLLSPQRNELLGQIRVKYISSHMIFNFFLNTSLILSYYLFFQSKEMFGKWYKIGRVFLCVAILPVFSVLLLSEGRMGLVMGILIVFIILGINLWKWNKKVAILTLAVLVVGVGFVISKNPRLNPEFLKKEPRLIIWSLATNEIDRTHFIGEGASTATENFMNILIKNPIIQAKNDGALSEAFAERNILGSHAHNQFLQTSMEYGLLGALLLLFICIFPLFIVDKNLRRFLFLFVMICITQLLTDILISGITPLFFLFLIALFLSENRNTNAFSEHLTLAKE